MGIARRGVLKELEVYDFDKTWSACQRDDGSCCEKVSEFLVVTFSYNQTKCYHGHKCNSQLWSDSWNAACFHSFRLTHTGLRTSGQPGPKQLRDGGQWAGRILMGFE